MASLAPEGVARPPLNTVQESDEDASPTSKLSKTSPSKSPEGRGSADAGQDDDGLYEPGEDLRDPNPYETVEEIQAHLVEIQAINDKKRRETVMLEEWLSNYMLEARAEEDAKSHAGKNEIDSMNKAAQKKVMQKSVRGSRRAQSRRMTARNQTSGDNGRIKVLTPLQKLTIAHKKLTVTQNQTDQDAHTLAKKATATVDKYDAALEELGDLNNRDATFCRMVDTTRIKSRNAAMMIASANGGAGSSKKRSSMVLDPTVVPTESITQDYLLAARNLHKWAERYFLQSNALRVKCKTVAGNIEATQGEEAQMTVVDYHRLKITNSEYRRVLTECHSEVAKLKVAVGHRTKKVQATRDVVDALEKTTVELKEKYKKQLGNFDKIAADELLVEKATKDLEASVAKLRQRLERNRAPSILDFAQMKEDLGKVHHHCEQWSNRVSVQGGNAGKWKQVWREARGAVEGEMRGRFNGGSGASNYSDGGAVYGDGRGGVGGGFRTMGQTGSPSTGRIRSAQHGRGSLQREKAPMLKQWR